MSEPYDSFGAVIDWRTMDPWIPGIAEDALGRELPGGTVRVNRLTGEAWVLKDGKMQIDESGELLLKKLQMVPPITVWLLT